MRFGALVFLLLGGCSEEPPPEPLRVAFPADYADTYSEVRDCRKSGDHELDFVRILADPRGLGPYENRTDPFPDGAVVLKEEYDFGDNQCAGDIIKWTVMVKASAATDRLGWTWQSVSADRQVLEMNASRCQNCHLDCSGGTAGGYDYTCSEPR